MLTTLRQLQRSRTVQYWMGGQYG